MNKNTKAHIALFTANLIYGANYIIAKEVMNGYMEPFGLILLRGLFTVLLLHIFHRLFIKEKIKREDIFRIALCAVFGIAINQLLFFKGLDITTPINASIIITTNPVLVLLLSALILKEKISLNKAIGIALAICGAVAIIASGRVISTGSDTVKGDIMIIINASSYAFYLVLIKPMMNKYNPMTVITWVYTFGLLYVAPFGFNELTVTQWRSFPTDIWVALLYVVFCTTFLAYSLNSYAMKPLSPTVVSSYLYLQPVFSTIFALWFGKDELSFIKIMAAMMIFTGVFMVVKATDKKIKTKT